MTKKKKGGMALQTKKNKEARAAFRKQGTPPQPYSPILLSPQSTPPPVPYKAYIQGPDLDAHTTNEAGSISAPDDHGNEDSNLGVSRVREKWAKLGYYDHHPNHNPANASEAQLKAIFQGHEKLGPILKEYRLLLNHSKKRTLLLQYPNRDYGQEYRAVTGQKPLELRIKPKCGLVELDIPMDIHSHFDKEKGIEYGDALRNSRHLQQGGSYGLGGGLGVGPRPVKDDRRAAPPDGPPPEKLLENFDDSNNKGRVMNKITLGGRIVPFKDGDPIYMTATFRGDLCTWTKLDAMVQLRPEFGHIDALHESDKSVWRQERAFDERATTKPEINEAQAVNMAVKSTENNDDLDMYGGMSETAKLLKAMRDEPWQRLNWVDQDADESYEVYDENLVYQDPANAPQLVSEMTDEQYLDAISCPRHDLAKQGENVLAGDEASTAGSQADVNGVEELILDDTEDEKDDAEALPPGVILPDWRQYGRVEMLCRSICIKQEKHQDSCETLLKQKLQGRAEFSFLFPRDPHHLYYKWRLAENRAGRGNPPEEDI